MSVNDGIAHKEVEFTVSDVINTKEKETLLNDFVNFLSDTKQEERIVFISIAFEHFRRHSDIDTSEFMSFLSSLFLDAVMKEPDCEGKESFINDCQNLLELCRADKGKSKKSYN